MKKFKTIFATVTLFASFIVLSLACASTKNISTLPESYEEIVEISGSKDSLYTKANLVFVDLFNNADSVLQYSDKEAGVMKGKYVSNISLSTSEYTTYTTVEVSVKDNKYRISMNLSDVVETSNFWTGRNKPHSVSPTDEILSKMDVEWKVLAASFKNKMNKDSSW